jgi:hypothetical protein
LDFEELAKQRLEHADRTEKLNVTPEEVAWEMMKSRDFQNTKCEHGGPDDTPVFSVPVPRISPAYTNTAVGLENGEMQFTRLVLLYHIRFVIIPRLTLPKERNSRNYLTVRWTS